jgi:hypothetical protein
MATGRKAFSGSSQASLISAIMKEDPAPIAALQPMISPALDRVVPNGREIFYRKEKKFLRAAITTSPAFSASRPELLFEGDYEAWDISRDGKRFLLVKDEAAESAPKHLNLVLDWFEDLKLRAPAIRK